MSTQFIQEVTTFLQDAGYAESNIIPECRFTARSADDALVASKVDIAAFSRFPHDTRAACIAAFDEVPGRKRETLDLLRYLTSPLAIVGSGDRVEFWPIRKESAAEPIDVCGRDRWQERVRGRIRDYSPSTLTEAKNDRIQLDFVDAGLATWMQSITSNSLKKLLDNLMRDSLNNLAQRYKDNGHARSAVLRLIFQLFACRALEDKGVITPSIDARGALTEANTRFSKNVTPSILDSQYLTGTLIESVFRQLRQSFSFDTLTTDVLAYSYENALVTSGIRRDLGIYYTPRSLTEYILRRMPIEAIDKDQRFLWDPCAGCGSFLLAGFDRLAESLPPSWDGQQRHRYLTDSIFGSDLDAFACEMASLALVLTDLHNRNGWSVREMDALTVKATDLPRQPTIIVTNLPFKESKSAGVRREVSADILEHLIDLAAPNAIMGIVLPQSILDAKAAINARRKILQQCNVLEIDLLPGGLFKSHADTAVLILQKTGPESQSITTVRELRSVDFERFARTGTFTRTYPADPAEWLGDHQSRFRVSPMRELWKTLGDRLGTLGDIATVNSGIRLRKGDRTSESQTKRDNRDKPYINRVDFVRPFALLVGPNLRPTLWLRYGPHLDRARKPELFEGTKVLINSNRNPGSAWRLVAAVSRETLYVSENFHVVISNGDVNEEVITAVLNSPIANAWFDSRSRKRKVIQGVLMELPFPSFDKIVAREISKKVREMEKVVIAKWRKKTEGMFFDEPTDTPNAARLLCEIDELVYDAYGISKNDRNQIDKLMRTDKRPG